MVSWSPGLLLSFGSYVCVLFSLSRSFLQSHLLLVSLLLSTKERKTTKTALKKCRFFITFLTTACTFSASGKIFEKIRRPISILEVGRRVEQRYYFLWRKAAAQFDTGLQPASRAKKNQIFEFKYLNSNI